MGGSIRRVLLLSPLLALAGCLYGRPAAYPPPPPLPPHHPHHVVPHPAAHWYWNGSGWVLVHGHDEPQ